PGPCGRWALPTTVPWGARTFLRRPPKWPTATVRPAGCTRLHYTGRRHRPASLVGRSSRRPLQWMTEGAKGFGLGGARPMPTIVLSAADRPPDECRGGAVTVGN